MQIILNGILTGLLLSVLIGATFFMLIETSMTRGFRAAIWFDAGVVLCDAMLITGAYFFTAWINRMIVHNEYFNTAGGIIFMAFGINYILARKRNDSGGKILVNKHLRVFLNGFFINLLNPSVLIFWLGTMALTLSKFSYSGRQVFLYYTATLITMVSVDILKAYFAYRLSGFINAHVLKIVYVISGLIMIGLGLWLVIMK
jgi:threonine/homoserine/homoserine lactone efflux protein